MKRVVALILAIAVVAGSATVSQAHSRDRHGGKPAGLELTYKKWTSPFPNFVGVVGGDIVGKFGGAVYTATPDATGRVEISAIYIVIATDPSQSFTAHVQGGWDASHDREGRARRPGRRRVHEGGPCACEVRHGQLHRVARRYVLPGDDQRPFGLGTLTSWVCAAAFAAAHTRCTSSSRFTASAPPPYAPTTDAM